MEKVKKLILEELLDDGEEVDPVDELTIGDVNVEVPTPEVNLTPEETKNMHVWTISDVLTPELEIYSNLTSTLTNPELDETIKSVLSSVAEDTALIIGKLQQAFKEATDEATADVIGDGEEAAQEIAVAEETPVEDTESEDK